MGRHGPSEPEGPIAPVTPPCEGPCSGHPGVVHPPPVTSKATWLLCLAVLPLVFYRYNTCTRLASPSSDTSTPPSFHACPASSPELLWGRSDAHGLCNITTPSPDTRLYSTTVACPMPSKGVPRTQLNPSSPGQTRGATPGPTPLPIPGPVPRRIPAPVPGRPPKRWTRGDTGPMRPRRVASYYRPVKRPAKKDRARRRDRAQLKLMRRAMSQPLHSTMNPAWGMRWLCAAVPGGRQVALIETRRHRLLRFQWRLWDSKAHLAAHILASLRLQVDQAALMHGVVVRGTRMFKQSAPKFGASPTASQSCTSRCAARAPGMANKTHSILLALAICLVCVAPCEASPSPRSGEQRSSLLAGIVMSTAVAVCTLNGSQAGSAQPASSASSAQCIPTQLVQDQFEPFQSHSSPGAPGTCADPWIDLGTLDALDATVLTQNPPQHAQHADSASRDFISHPPASTIPQAVFDSINRLYQAAFAELSKHVGVIVPAGHLHVSDAVADGLLNLMTYLHGGDPSCIPVTGVGQWQHYSVGPFCTKLMRHMDASLLGTSLLANGTAAQLALTSLETSIRAAISKLNDADDKHPVAQLAEEARVLLYTTGHGHTPHCHGAGGETSLQRWDDVQQQPGMQRLFLGFRFAKNPGSVTFQLADGTCMGHLNLPNGSAWWADRLGEGEFSMPVLSAGYKNTTVVNGGRLRHSVPPVTCTTATVIFQIDVEVHGKGPAHSVREGLIKALSDALHSGAKPAPAEEPAGLMPGIDLEVSQLVDAYRAMAKCRGRQATSLDQPLWATKSAINSMRASGGAISAQTAYPKVLAYVQGAEGASQHPSNLTLKLLPPGKHLAVMELLVPLYLLSSSAASDSGQQFACLIPPIIQAAQFETATYLAKAAANRKAAASQLVDGGSRVAAADMSVGLPGLKLLEMAENNDFVQCCVSEQRDGVREILEDIQRQMRAGQLPARQWLKQHQPLTHEHDQALSTILASWGAHMSNLVKGASALTNQLTQAAGTSSFQELYSGYLEWAGAQLAAATDQVLDLRPLVYATTVLLMRGRDKVKALTSLGATWAANRCTRCGQDARWPNTSCTQHCKPANRCTRCGQDADRPNTKCTQHCKPANRCTTCGQDADRPNTKCTQHCNTANRCTRCGQDADRPNTSCTQHCNTANRCTTCGQDARLPNMKCTQHCNTANRCTRCGQDADRPNTKCTQHCNTANRCTTCGQDADRPNTSCTQHCKPANRCTTCGQDARLPNMKCTQHCNTANRCTTCGQDADRPNTSCTQHCKPANRCTTCGQDARLPNMNCTQHCNTTNRCTRCGQDADRPNTKCTQHCNTANRCTTCGQDADRPNTSCTQHCKPANRCTRCGQDADRPNTKCTQHCNTANRCTRCGQDARWPNTSCTQHCNTANRCTTCGQDADRPNTSCTQHCKPANRCTRCGQDARWPNTSCTQHCNTANRCTRCGQDADRPNTKCTQHCNTANRCTTCGQDADRPNTSCTQHCKPANRCTRCGQDADRPNTKCTQHCNTANRCTTCGQDADRPNTSCTQHCKPANRCTTCGQDARLPNMNCTQHCNTTNRCTRCGQDADRPNTKCTQHCNTANRCTTCGQNADRPNTKCTQHCKPANRCTTCGQNADLPNTSCTQHCKPGSLKAYNTHTGPTAEEDARRNLAVVSATKPAVAAFTHQLDSPDTMAVFGLVLQASGGVLHKQHVVGQPHTTQHVLADPVMRSTLLHIKTWASSVQQQRQAMAIALTRAGIQAGTAVEMALTFAGMHDLQTPPAAAHSAQTFGAHLAGSLMTEERASGEAWPACLQPSTGERGGDATSYLVQFASGRQDAGPNLAGQHQLQGGGARPAAGPNLTAPVHTGAATTNQAGAESAECAHVSEGAHKKQKLV